MPLGDKFINYFAQQPKQDKSFDKSFKGYIVETFPDYEDGSKNFKYRVSVNGSVYTTFCNGVVLTKGMQVPVVVPCNNWSRLYIDLQPQQENKVVRPHTICLRDLDGDNIKEDVTIYWHKENTENDSTQEDNDTDMSQETNTASQSVIQHFSLSINSNEEVTAINWDDGSVTTFTDTLLPEEAETDTTT